MTEVAARSHIVIAGPTAIGKTAVAVELAAIREGSAEILSADSVQVYRRLDIGSAKPTPNERRRAVFHLIDIVAPDQEFTLADFQQHAVDALQDLTARGKTGIIAGGTGLYIRALTQPLGLPHVPPNEELRAQWREYAECHRGAALLAVVAEHDPETAARLHFNDTKRLIRAIEVREATGRTLSEWHREDRESGKALAPNARIFALNRDREKLYASIEQRVDAMMDAGFEREVRSLREAGHSPSLKSMQALGYKEINAAIDGKIAMAEAVDLIKRRTRRFARRQLIWFRADPRISWIDVEGRSASDVAAQIASEIT